MEETYWNHLIVKLVLVSLFCWNFLKVWSNLPLQSLIVYLVGVISLFRDIWDIIELWLTLCKRYLYLCVYVNSYVWYSVFILDLIRVLDIYHVLWYIILEYHLFMVYLQKSTWHWILWLLVSVCELFPVSFLHCFLLTRYG